MNDGKIIIDKIIADADETVKKILAEAKESAGATVKAAEEKAEKERARSAKALAEEKDKIIAKQISGAEMQAKKAVLAEKQRILEEVIEEAQKRLISLPDGRYSEVIGKMLDNIDKSLGTEVIVAPKDRDRLAGVVEQKGFALSDRTENISGGFHSGGHGSTPFSLSLSVL